MKQSNKVRETSLFQDNPRFELFKDCILLYTWGGLWIKKELKQSKESEK